MYIDDVKVPWSPGGGCPCGSRKPFSDCCLNVNGVPVGKAFNLCPPGPLTGYRHPKCYMGATMNCSEKISGEHLISESVAKSVGDFTLYGGLANAGKPERIIIARTATANILCKRHNEATTHLDTEAGRYFFALRETRRSMQSGHKGGAWAFLNGNLIELWAVKTAVNLHYAGMTEYDGQITREACSLDEPLVIGMLSGQGLPSQIGNFVKAGMHFALEDGNLAPIALQPHFDPLLRRLVGVKLWAFGIVSYVVFDGLNSPFQSFDFHQSSYRPNVLRIDKPGYTSRIVLAWKDAGPNGPLRAFYSTRRKPPSES